jgi:hypothetical protein
MRMKITQHALVWGLILFIVIFFNVSLVSADMIEPGKKLIHVQYKITNIDEYPDYVFLVYYFSPMIGYLETTPDKEFSGYKFSSASIYAIQESEYLKINIGSDDKEIKDFFENNPSLIQSNVRLTFLGKTVPDIDPLETQIILFEITDLTKTSVTLRLSSLQYRYTDGSSEEVTYPVDELTPAIIHPSELPEPSSRQIIGAWYFIVPTAAFFGIVVVIKTAKLRVDK